MTFKQNIAEPLDSICACQACNSEGSTVEKEVTALTTAHVVCCNDSIEAVVLGTEAEAQKVCYRLKKEWLAKEAKGGRQWDENKMPFWHVHDGVKILEK